MHTGLTEVVLVSGAARRIGAAIARALHADGWTVALHCGQSRAEADALAATLNATRAGSAAVFTADLRDAGAINTLAQHVADQFGPVRALVNNASSYGPTPFGQITATQIDELAATNFRAPLLLTQAVHAQGTLIAVVNLLDAHTRQQPRAGFSAYNGAKDALWALTETLAMELAPAVRVNGVALGHIAAEVRAQPSAAELADLEDKSTQLARIPLARFGTPDDVADAVRWLLSPRSAYLTGAVIPVDGGRRLA